MKKQIVRLTESDLHNLIKESTKRILEYTTYSRSDYESGEESTTVDVGETFLDEFDEVYDEDECNEIFDALYDEFREGTEVDVEYSIDNIDPDSGYYGTTTVDKLWMADENVFTRMAQQGLIPSDLVKPLIKAIKLRALEQMELDRCGTSKQVDAQLR